MKSIKDFTYIAEINWRFHELMIDFYEPESKFREVEQDSEVGEHHFEKFITNSRLSLKISIKKNRMIFGNLVKNISWKELTASRKDLMTGDNLVKNIDDFKK